jgi:hypothetical protein
MEPGGWDSEFASEMCAQDTCRGPITVRLLLEDGSIFERSFSKATPVVQRGTVVTVFPGEEIHLAVSESNDGSLLLAAVQNGGNLSLALTQGASELGPASMELSVRNTSPTELKFDLLLMYPTSEGTRYTSSCSVAPGQTSLELWHEPIFQVVASNFRAMEDGRAARLCE